MYIVSLAKTRNRRGWEHNDMTCLNNERGALPSIMSRTYFMVWPSPNVEICLAKASGGLTPRWKLLARVTEGMYGTPPNSLVLIERLVAQSGLPFQVNTRLISWFPLPAGGYVDRGLGQLTLVLASEACVLPLFPGLKIHLKSTQT